MSVITGSPILEIYRFNTELYTPYLTFPTCQHEGSNGHLLPENLVHSAFKRTVVQFVVLKQSSPTTCFVTVYVILAQI